MVRPRHSAGFSLIELMVTVAIIGIISAAILPSMTEVMADHREASAAMDVLRLARKARALTLENGTAYMLRYQVSASGLGWVDLLQGMNGRCMQTPWAQAYGRPIEWFDMKYYNPKAGGVPTANDLGRHVIKLHAGTPGNLDVTELQLCYQPNGEVYISMPPLVALTRQADAMLVTLSLTREVNHVPHGERREVIFPAGGSARAR